MKLRIVATLIVASALVGCGESNSSAPAVTTDGSPVGSSTSGQAASATTPAPSDTTAPSADGTLHPCDVLTTAEMTSFFGAPVESTEIPYESVTPSVQCLWNKVSESVGGADKLPAHSVLVQVLTDQYDLDQLHKKIDRGGVAGLSSPVAGIGDGAILVAGGEGISVAVGQSGFNLLIALDPVPTDEAIEALARSVVTRMP
jgi:hypothetical protein